jgi:ComF family protein
MRPIDVLFPPFCAVCDRPGHLLCQRHLNDLCWNYQSPIDGWIWSALEYRDSAQSIVIQVKYAFYYRYVELMAQLIRMRYPAFSERGIDLIIPVPLHRRKLKWRGFNQAGLLAEKLSANWNVPVDTTSLVRTRHAKSQASQDRESRKKIARQFQSEASLSGMKVLLIDDVVTTGSTLADCRRALIEAGAAKISALTFAREI